MTGMGVSSLDCRNVMMINDECCTDYNIIFTFSYQEQNPFEGSGLYSHLTRMEVERELVKHKELLKKKDSHIRELEDYIDNLLVRVMEETPSILRVPYVPSRKAGKFPQS